MSNFMRPAWLFPVMAIALCACGPTAPSGSVPPGTITTGTSTSCPGAATSSPDFGAPNLGIYNGVTLPNGWVSQAKVEADITARIATLANDTSPSGAVSYVMFKCSFPAAAYIYNHRDGAAPASTLPTTGGNAASPSPASSAAAAPSPSPTASPIATATPTTAPTVAPSGICTSPSTSPQPAGSAKGSEASVTASISGLQIDTTADGINTWASFKCNYPAAYAAWQAAQAPSPSPTASIR
jgi:hypothetical protein